MNFRNDVAFRLASQILDVNVNDKGACHRVCISGDLAFGVGNGGLPKQDR